MKALNALLSLFIKQPKSVYGPQIFVPKSWLTKQVEEAQYKQFKNQQYNVR